MAGITVEPFLSTKAVGLPFAFASTEPSSIFSEKVTVGLAVGLTFLPVGSQDSTVGLVVSTEKVRLAGVASELPAASVARTSKVYVP